MATETGFAILQEETRSSTAARMIPIVTLGLALSTFLAVSYLVCIAGYLLLPGLPIEHGALSAVLPGFTLLTWPSFFFGLAESVIWAWYIALVFGSIYNFFARWIMTSVLT